MADRVRVAENLLAVLLIGAGVMEIYGWPWAAVVVGALILASNLIAAKTGESDV
jgi:hypothetical protein